MIFYTLEHILRHISVSMVSIVIPMLFINLLLDGIIGLYESLEKGTIAAFVCISGLLVTRWIYSGHLPLSTLYESLIFLSWSFFIISTILYFNPYFHFKKHKKKLILITALSALFIQGFTTSGFLSEMQESALLVPALQSQWLIMHVSMMVLAYAALLCGSLLSVSIIVITFRKRKILRILKINNLFNVNETFLFDEIQSMDENVNLLPNTSFLSCKNYYTSRLIQQLDCSSYPIISIGFFFLTMGILSGAIWANEAWGSYWSWDPKETWAFITWSIFAIYLHIRTHKKWEIINSAIMAFIGFLIIWIGYFGVNLLGLGLHSYGSFTLNLH